MSTKNVEDKPRFNVADAIIIIVALLVIAGIAFRVYSVLNTEDTLDSVIVEYEITNISSDHIDLYQYDKLYLTSDDSSVGYIMDVSVSDMTEYAYTADGELVKATVKGKSTVTGKMVLDGTVTDHGFYLGGTTLLTESQEISFYTVNREVIVKIVKISG